MLFMTCTQRWETVQKQQGSAGCAPWSTPWRGDSLAALGWEFEAELLHPPLPKERHHKPQSVPPYSVLGKWDVPVGNLPWLGHVLAGSDFWARAEFSVCSSV